MLAFNKRANEEAVFNLLEDCYLVGGQGLPVHNTSPGGSPGSSPVPTPGTIPQAEVDAVRKAWANNPQDIAIGLYNPYTGEIHIGTYDTTGKMGHDGLQKALLIPDTDRANWRGFVFLPNGQALNQSGFNIVDGGMAMRSEYYAQVLDALKRATLI